MRLERLEINGFKSFSDRSELAFDKGVTAIVGPNGCGKSNVADAITWVMGEQSAKSLRGDKMEDVIFSGSDARKPTAAAEVRLRFSGFLKTVSGPAFPPEPGHDEEDGEAGAKRDPRPAPLLGHDVSPVLRARAIRSCPRSGGPDYRDNPRLSPDWPLGGPLRRRVAGPRRPAPPPRPAGWRCPASTAA